MPRVKRNIVTPKNGVAIELARVIKQIDELRQAEERLREQLLPLMTVGEAIETPFGIVRKTIYEEAVKDEEFLKELGIYEHVVETKTVVVPAKVKQFAGTHPAVIKTVEKIVVNRR